MHEESFRATVAGALAELQTRQAGNRRIKGEFTLVLGPIGGGGDDGAEEVDMGGRLDIEAALLKLKKDGLSRSDAVKMLAKMGQVSKSSVYQIALHIDDW